MIEIQHAAIGIDIGSYVSCLAVAKRGGVQIITNQANFRQTPTIVGYGAGERLIGEAGNAKLKTNFRDTVTYPNRFLGLNFSNPRIQEELKFIPAKSSKGQNGKLYFNVNYQGQQEQLSSQQVVAGFISKLRSIISMNKLANNEAVISVPSYYTQLERQALLNAAKIAELNVTRLLNESSAVALDYGIFRRNDLDAKNPRNVLFVDFGHSKFSVFVAGFTKEKVTILSQKHNRFIGCRDIDYLLLQYYQKIFQKSSGGIDFMENRKSIVKMFQVIEKQRKILSANSEHQINVQCLQEDCDLDSNLKRQEFQKIAQPVFIQISKILNDFKIQLESKNIAIHTIEMVGGGTRIPAVQKLLQSVFKLQPMRTLNSSESIAKGCALMAAMKSPLFRVAPYVIQQINYYPIRAYWNFIQDKVADVDEKKYPQKQTSVLFPSGCLLPVTKTLKFTRKQSIQILLVYDPHVEGFNHHIGYYRTQAQNPKQKQFSVTYKIGVNQNGLVNLDQCFLQEDTTEQTKIVKPKSQGDPADKQPEYEIKTSKKTQQKPLTFQVKIDQHLTNKEVAACFQVESKMVNQDRHLLETYQRKNELQSLIYNTRQKLGSTYKEFVQANQLPKILEAISAASNWLQSEGQHSTRGMYIQKLDALKPLIQPIHHRYVAHEDIKQALFLASQAVEVNNALLNSSDPKYSHISGEDRAPAGKQIQKLQQLISSTSVMIQTAPKHQNYKVSAGDLSKQTSIVNDGVKKIMSKKVPTKVDPAQPSSSGSKMEQQKPADEKPKEPQMDVEK